MPAAAAAAAMDYQASSVPFGSIGRSILSIRRDQFHADEQQDQELDSFQKRAADLFSDLHSSPPDDLLSLSWLRRLLDAFLLCQEEFRVILFNSRPLLSRPPVDRALNDFFDRAVRALDLCNAVRDGIDQLRQWASLLRIVPLALPPGRPLGEGQLRRARKALADLAILMIDDRDPPSSAAGSGSSLLSHRNRSFGRNSNGGGGGGTTPREARRAHFRSLSWSVSRSWSASKQLQAMGSSLSAPRGNEVSQTSGLAVPVYTMSSVLLFVMWALVAAIPCQDRGLQQTHLSVPRSFAWAAAVTGLHERILEESKRKERRGASGLLKEVHAMERSSRSLAEMLDAAHVPMGEEKEAEVRAAVEELAAVCAVLGDGLDPLETQVRELFYRIVRSRTEGLDCLGKSHGGE